MNDAPVPTATARVVRCKRNLSPQEIENVRAAWDRAREGFKTIFLSSDFEVIEEPVQLDLGVDEALRRTAVIQAARAWLAELDKTERKTRISFDPLQLAAYALEDAVRAMVNPGSEVKP